MSFEAKLLELGLVLPRPPKPVATYVPAVRADHLLFLSGVLPYHEGKVVPEGKLGREVSVEAGQEAARLAVLNALAIVHAELGTLDRVRQVIRLVGYVASAEGFIQQPAVINGASDLLVRLFDDVGRHARVAVGVAELPLRAPVELELVVQVF